MTTHFVHRLSSSSLSRFPACVPACFLALAVGLTFAGCGRDGSSDLVAYQNGVSVENRLVYNRLVYNRLVYNRLVYNRLVYNRLDDTHLQIASDSGIETTEEGRDLLTYIARCALAEGDVLVATHDGVTYDFPGLLALAPEWETQALSETKQRLISACLLAHVNAFGDSVLISVRSGGYIASSPDERRAFPVYEGTFFGQVFGDDGLLTYACQGDEAPVAGAHSMSRARRVCTDPDGPCEIQSVGRCRDVCEEQVMDNGWRGCYGGGQRFDETIGAYLFADDPDGQNRTCGAGGKCALTSAPATRAILDCIAGDDCTGTCSADATCTIDGALGHTIRARVKPRAVAEISCLDTNRCEMGCDDASCELGCRDAHECKAKCEHEADCTIDCRGTDNCEHIKCESGATCQLWCAPGTKCKFERCWHPDHAVQCPDGSLVCGQPCPASAR